MPLKGQISVAINIPMPGRRAKALPKRQLRVLLLDLYVAWCTDPTLGIGIAMNRDAYRSGSRYNELHISPIVIDLVRHAVEGGLLVLWKGSEGAGKVSRIWPTEELVRRFQQARFGLLDVGSVDRECIVLNGEGRPLEYEDSGDRVSMRTRLQAYNALLRRTFVDIPTLDRPQVVLPASSPKKRPTTVTIGQHNKFVRRVFYRGSWELGGRFHGGWWQQLPKAWRQEIYIDDQPTIEDDFSGLHIALLYGMEGAELTGDPYALELDLPYPADTIRSWVKSLALVTINARSEKKAFGAFRSEQPTGSPAKKFSDAQLLAMLDAFRAKHPAIAHHLCSDVGVKLMAIDGRIAARVIDHFTAIDVPVLSIHDSFIVPVRWAGELRRVMERAAMEELSISRIDIKTVVKTSGGWVKGLLGYSRICLKTAGYRNRMSQFETWSCRTLIAKGDSVAQSITNLHLSEIVISKNIYRLNMNSDNVISLSKVHMSPSLPGRILF